MNTPNSPNVNNRPNHDDEIDLAHYLSLFLSNWYWFAIALFLALTIAYGFNNYSEKIYSVSSSLLIKDDQAVGDMTGIDRIIPGGDVFRSQQNLQNEIGILKSYSLNFRVMEKLPEFQTTTLLLGRRGIAKKRLFGNAPFIVMADRVKEQPAGRPVNIEIHPDETFTIEIDGMNNGKKAYSFGEKISEAGFEFSILKNKPESGVYNAEFSNRYKIWFSRTEALANQYRSKLNISPLNDDASLVTISVSGTDPVQESMYLNKLMEEYIQQGLDFKNQTVEKTIEFIDQQLGLISDSLTLAESKLESFRLSNKLIDLSSEGSAIKTRLENYTKERITVGLQKQYYDYLSDYLNSKNESGDIVSPSVMGVTDNMLITLVEELSSLQLQKKQLRYNFSGNQPAISLIDSKIGDARKAMNENVRNSIINVERTLKDIDNRITGVEGELNKLPGTERKLINIQRKFDLNNTVYTYMLEKRSEAGIAKASNVSGNRIIDRAEAFNSVMIAPKRNRNYMIALLLGFLIPGIYIILIEQFQNKILDKKDIERGTKVPVIGYIGHNNAKNEIPVISKPGSALAESFRSVRTNLRYYLNGEKKAVISVTSTISGEGKTFVSLNLASVIAMLGKKTLLIGLDMRRPRLNKLLASSDHKGLSNFLIGEADFENIITRTEVSNLHFIPSGPVPPNPSELIESEKMKEFMNMAKERYDYIILDTPPAGVVSDAMLLGAFADVNIFVIRQRFSFKSTLELIQNIFDKKELKNLTIAVNDIHISGYFGYGLRYGYGPYQGYGYSYGNSHYGSYGVRNQKYYRED